LPTSLTVPTTKIQSKSTNSKDSCNYSQESKSTNSKGSIINKAHKESDCTSDESYFTTINITTITKQIAQVKANSPQSVSKGMGNNDGGIWLD
jgi:hypothetical protein